MSKNIWVCILCGSRKRALLYKEKRLPNAKITASEALCTGEIGARGKYAKIWKCKSCGLIFQDTSFSATELCEAYENGIDERYFEQKKQREELFHKSLKKIEKFRKEKGKLLDVGAGAGLFVYVARKSGWKAEGIDPSLWASLVARKKFKSKIMKSTLENFKSQPKFYDVITMWDVLEHYVNPVFALKKIRKLLKDNGVLGFTTINIDGWFSKLLGPHWTWLIRIHLWYFTKPTLVKMLKECGFEVVWLGGQVRWFSLPYLLSRFTGWNFPWMPKIILPAPTGDIIFVIAKKK